MSVLLGAIADDFTGATDLANTLVKEGMSAVQTIGVPDERIDLDGVEAVVVALKSRTTPVDDAVSSSLKALDWLRTLGVEQVFFKYCSTFDSTDEGNIGPVADALIDALDGDFAVVCPAFPDNGRVIRDGLLYVNGERLSESPMKDHPLTPMRDSDLVALMSRQSDRQVGLVDQSVVSQGAEKIAKQFDALRDKQVSYGVVDVAANDDLREIGRALAGHKLVTGGSGIALGLPANFGKSSNAHKPASPSLPAPAGRAVVIAGSCSQATRAQIARAKNDWPTYKLDMDRIADGSPVVGEAVRWATTQDEATPVLIYGSSDPAEVARAQEKYGRDEAGAMMENALGGIARELVAKGARRVIVAGGETSGAVVSALNVKALRIGPEIDPGVPWTQTLGDPTIALALKSGNFGGEDFFAKALEMLP